MPDLKTVHTDLVDIRSELLDLDRTMADDSTRRTRLAKLVRRVAFTHILSADQEDRRLARRLVHACLARLTPLQEAGPASVPGLLPSPDEEWILAPATWRQAHLDSALEEWRAQGDRRPNLVLLIPTAGLAAQEVVFPLHPDRSARQIGVSGLLALAAPTVLIGAGDPAAAVAEAIRRATS